LERKCSIREVFRDREVGRSKGRVKERSILEILYILKI